MKRLLWGGSARVDLYRIARLLGAIVPDLPLMLLDRIQAAPLVLLENPGLGAPFGDRGWRKWRVKRTPFVLLCKVVGSDLQIRRVVDSRSDLLRLLR